MIFTGILAGAALGAARQYELVAIHSDSMFAYSTIQFDSSTSQLALNGDPISFEFENGGLVAHTKTGRGVIEIKNGIPAVEYSSEYPTNYGWSLKDNIYLQGTYWLCGNEQKTISTGEINAPRSCINPTNVMLYASPILA